MSSRFVAALLACVACGHGVPAARKVPLLPAPVVHAGELDAEKLTRDLSAIAVAIGAGPPSSVASGQIAGGERLGAFVDVPAEVCLLAYARGSRALEDIDLAAYSDEGDSVAADEGPDARPSVLVCPPHPQRVYLAVHAASGEGLVAVVAHLSPVAIAPALQGAFRSRGAPAGVVRSDAWVGLDEAVSERRLKVGGLWEDQRRVAVAVDARAPTFVGLPIEAGQCVQAFVLASEEVKDLDVEVQAESETAVARATTHRREASVVVCAEFAVRASLVLRAHVGIGAAAVVVAQASAANAADFADSVNWLAPAKGVTAAQAGVRLESDLARLGYPKPTATTALNIVAAIRGSARVEPVVGCARVDLITGAPAATFRASLWTDQGAALSEASGLSRATLFTCASVSALLELETQGRGGAVAMLVRPEIWRDASFVAFPVAASRMLTRASAGPGGLMVGEASGVRAFAVDSGRREAWDRLVPRGNCAFFIAGAQGDGSGLSLEVRDVEADAIVDRSSSARGASVRACARVDRPKTVRIIASTAAGKLDVVVGERLRATTP